MRAYSVNTPIIAVVALSSVFACPMSSAGGCVPGCASPRQHHHQTRRPQEGGPHTAHEALIHNSPLIIINNENLPHGSSLWLYGSYST
jgi:hypothetical protein